MEIKNRPTQVGIWSIGLVLVFITCYVAQSNILGLHHDLICQSIMAWYNIRPGGLCLPVELSSEISGLIGGVA